MAMSDEKLREAFLACEKLIADAATKEGITMAIRDGSATDRPRKLSHVWWLTREGLKLVEAGRREKAMRWLGFIQGAISWGLELCTVDQLKDMNRPDDSKFDKDRV